jgi:glycosyltransferase involved in cell wall biosynthesis
MKILMLTRGNLWPSHGALPIGGAGRQCCKLSKALQKNNIDITIATIKPYLHHPFFKKINGINIFFLNTFRPYLLKKGLRRIDVYLFIIVSLFFLYKNKKKYDIIHAHSGLIAGFIAVFAGKLLKKSCLVKIMNSGSRNDIYRLKNDKNIFGSKFMAKFMINCDYVIALNDLAYNELLNFGFKKNKIKIIPNGIDVYNSFQKKSYNFKNDFCITYIGRLNFSKRVDILLDAINILSNKNEIFNLKLNIVGKGNLFNDLEKMVKNLKLDNYVNFLGELSNVEKILCKSDIFVLPSQNEGISNALLEAMAAGVPCIATDISGNRALIKNNLNGLLFKIANSQELANKIKELYRDTQLRRKLGEEARRTVYVQYNINDIAKKYIELYKNCLKINNDVEKESSDT